MPYTPMLLLWLFLLLPGVSSLNYYYLEGNLATISPSDIKAIDHLNLENNIRNFIDKSIENQRFFVDKFEIHGEGFETPTVIFIGYLESPLSRDEILQRSYSPLTIFYLIEIDSLPPRSVEYSNDASFCSNGGILLPNITCACPPFFTDANCQTIQCLHQGISDSKKCFCPPGVYSLNCEPRACLPAVNSAFANTQKTLMLVLNTKSSMAYVLNYLVTNIGNILDRMNNSTNTQYSNYILTTYVTGNSFVYMKTNYFSSSAALESYLLGYVSVSNGLDLQPTNRAILQTQSFTGNMKSFSNILVFTDSLDSEAQGNDFVLSATSQENLLILRTITWRNKIVYLLSQSATNSTNMTDSFSSYQQVVKSTLGDLISYDSRQIDQMLNSFMTVFQNVEVIDAKYENSGTTTVNMNTDDSNDTGYVLITVAPNANLPTFAANYKPIINGSNFVFFSTTSADQASFKINGNGSPFSVKLFVNSLKTALVSYTSDSTVDVGDSFTSSDIPTFATLVSLNTQGTASLQWLDISTGSQFTSFDGFSTRTGECSYPSISTSTNSCPPGPFVQSVQLQSTGKTITRLLPGYCGRLNQPIPPSFVCLNNGTNISPTSCECSSNFNGLHCEIPICQNGGSVNPFPSNGANLCNCLTGYSGNFCEILNCNPTSIDSFDNTKRTFVMVMQSSMSQAQVGSSINSGLSIMLNMLTGDDAFSQYALATFNVPTQSGKNETVWNTGFFTDPSQFSEAVKNVSYLATSANSFDSFGVLYSVMTSVAYDRSSIFLFVDSPPSGIIQEMDVAWYAITREFEISIVITPPYNISGLCIQDISPYLTVVKKTGGVIYNLCASYTPNGMDPVVEFFRGFGASHHHTENIAEYLSPSCRAPSVMNFFIDDPMSDVFLFVNSETTQSFEVAFVNNDVPGTIILSPLTSTPFLAIYRIPTYVGNQKGFSITITDGTNTAYGGCYSKIVEKTTVAVFLGYSNNPSQDAFTKTLKFATPVYPTVHVSTPIDGIVNVDAQDNLMDLSYFSADVKRSNSCRYESYFKDQLICDSNQETFIVNVRTATPSGAVIQRSRRTICWLGEQQCLNGGNYFEGKCNCPVGRYLGEYCEYPMCQNGAELREYQCICGPERTGPLCEYERCDSLNYMEYVDPREVNYKQITFAINTNIDQLLPVVYITNWIDKFLQDVAVDYPQLYSLITFDNTRVNNVLTTPDKNVFSAQIKSIPSSTTWTSATSTLSLDAIKEAYKINIDPPSIIYLFVGTDAARSSATGALLKQQIGTQVNIIYAPQTVAYPGQPGGSYGAYLSVAARQSGGRIWPLTQNSLANLETSLANTVGEAELVLDDAQSDCTQGVTFNFLLDDEFNAVYFEVSGQGVGTKGNIVITNSNGNVVSFDTMSSVFLDSSMAILAQNYVPNQNTGGNWSLSITTLTGSCYVQVRTDSVIRVIPGFTSNENNDFAKVLPFSQYGTNSSAYVTFRLVDNRGGSNLMSVLNQLVISSGDFDKPWNGRKLLQTLNIRKRDAGGCASQYVSDAWVLDKSTYQKFVVYGSEFFDSGNPFQRTFFFSFTTSDKTTTCVSGTRNANGECLCDNQHSGDYCTDRLCQNGGSQSYGICVCPNGYFGSYCEQLVSNSTFTTISTTRGPTKGPLATTTVIPLTTGKTTINPTTKPGTTAAVSSTTNRLPLTSTLKTSTTTASVLSSTSNSLLSSTGIQNTVTAASSLPTTSTSSAGTSTSTIKPTTNLPTSTSTIPSTTKKLVPTTRQGSTTSTILICDPYSTQYMVTLFLDATSLFDDPASGTYAVREQSTVNLLAQKLSLGVGEKPTRFLFNGVSSIYQYCGNATNQAAVNNAANCIGHGRDDTYDLTNALQQYANGPQSSSGNGEIPPIAVIFSATSILGGTNTAQPYIDQLTRNKYQFLGVDVSYSGAMASELAKLIGTQNVYTIDTPDKTSTWLTNKICTIKKF